MLNHDEDIFGWGLKDHSKYLYHYTRMDIALKYILNNKKIKIGKLINTNDPKESTSWKLSVGSNEGRNLGPHDLSDISEKVTRELKRKINVISLCKDKASLSGEPHKDFCKRGFCKPRMWAQYAENHEGICLVFDRNELHDAIIEQLSDSCEIYYGDVHYINRPLIDNFYDGTYTINIDYLEKFGQEHYLKMHTRQYYKRLFFEKMEDWQNEDEYRWVLIKKEEGDVFVNFGDSLKGIMFGVSTSQDQLDTVLKVTKEHKLTYEQLVWNNCVPWVSGRIKWESKDSGAAGMTV